MKNHVLLLNSPSINRDRYILGFVEELHRTNAWSDRPVLLLTRQFEHGLPDEYQELGLVHYHGDASNPDDLEAVNASEAAILLVLAENAGERRSDEMTFNILHRLKELDVKGRIIAECVRRANRGRLRDAGAHAVMRPIRFYPEIVVRAIDSPGSEQILENLFMSDGDECRAFDVPVRGLQWSALAAALMSHGLGTAIAFCDQDDPGKAVRCNPDPDLVITSDRLYVIVKPQRHITERDISAVIAGIETTSS